MGTISILRRLYCWKHPRLHCLFLHLKISTLKFCTSRFHSWVLWTFVTKYSLHAFRDFLWSFLPQEQEIHVSPEWQIWKFHTFCGYGWVNNLNQIPKISAKPCQNCTLDYKRAQIIDQPKHPDTYTHINAHTKLYWLFCTYTHTHADTRAHNHI